MAAHDFVGNARPGEIGFHGVRLGVHPVQHRMVAQFCALAQILADHSGDVAGLVLLVFGFVVVHLRTLAVFGPQGFTLAAMVVLNDAVGRVQNVGCGAVILLQPNDLCAGEMVLKVQDVFNGRPAEAVNALVIIAHHAHVMGAAAQKPHQMELRHTGVLIFVHQNVAIFVLIILQHVLFLLEQADRIVDQVVKVHGAGTFQPPLVRLVHLGDQARLGVCRGGQRLFGADQFVLQAADLPHAGLDGQELIVHHQLLVDFLHGPLLVIRVVDGEALGIAQPLTVPPQDPHTCRMEGGGVHVAALGGAKHGRQTALQLVRRLVGKGNGQHIPGAGRVLRQHGGQAGRGRRAHHLGRAQGDHVRFRHLAGGPITAVRLPETNDVCNAVDQHGGFAAACARQNQQRAFGMEHRLLLHRVQPPKAALNVAVPQFQEFLSKFIGHCVKPFLSDPLVSRKRRVHSPPFRS